MNLPVIISKVVNIARGVAGNGALLARKHAPALMIAAGVGGNLAAIVGTVKATNETNDILEEKERRMKICEKNLDQAQKYGEVKYMPEDYDMDIRTISRQTKFRIVKAWAPVATLYAASTVSILGGFKIVNGRLVATTAAYKVLENRMERYRGNVIERFGKEVDWEMANNVKAEDLEKARQEREENRKIDEENKGRKLVKKRKKTAYSDIYNCIFDEYSDRWQRYWTPELALEYLKQKQRELNDMLQIRKHVFLNEVYDKLGLERTSEGAVSGWIITHGNPDSCISLGIDEMPEEELREILRTRRNEDIRIKLRLVPDGLIYNMIDRPRLCD